MISASADFTQWIERAKAARVEDEISRRGIVLKRVTKTEAVGPCPVCGGTDRFGVNTRKQAFHCRGCGVGGGVIQLVQHLDGCDFETACKTLTREDRPQPRRMASKAVSTPQPADDARDRTATDLRIWSEARDPRHGTPGWTYLFRRGADLGAIHSRIDEALRWHPSCPWGSGRQGCLIALWTDIVTGEPRAIHRRPISPAGEKLDYWRALGPTAGCVIRLWPDEAVTQGLVLAEGIETAIVAATRIEHKGTLLQPIWAAGDRGHIASFPVLSGIDSVTLLVDHDTNQAGQRAAEQCAARWVGAGREVVRLTPRLAGTDFANVPEDAA